MKRLWVKIMLGGMSAVILGDLIWLNSQLLFKKPTVESISPLAKRDVPDSGFPTKMIVDETGKTLVLPNYDSIFQEIRNSTASLTLEVARLAPQPPQIKINTAGSPTLAKVSEYYIPLGSGNTVSTDWEDLAGIEAYVAPQNFGEIKDMYFEASLRNPTGNGRIYARLKNITDNNPLVESEVYREGTGGGLVSSGKIPPPIGTKLYRVQLKSTLGVQVYLDNARIKIFVR